jgi:hypothetical protein
VKGTLNIAVVLTFIAGAGGIGHPAGASPKVEMVPFDAGRAGFEVEVSDLVIPYEEFALFALPNAVFTVSAIPRVPGGTFELVAASGVVHRGDELSWTWIVPAEIGVTSLVVREMTSASEIRLNVFVMVPFERLEGETLNGYRIGSYPTTPFKGLAIYRPPQGFVEVTADNMTTKVSPHFTIGQFLCKQIGGYPKYLVLRPLLLLKLEMMLEKINEAGYRCDTFHVMSGYRTPYYNHAIGNVKYSRHQWGGAADVFIDVDPEDGVMDDLDGNGTIDVRDARRMFDLVDELYGAPWYAPYVGGLGLYRTTTNHGPFVHVDVRGFRARWGD